MFVLNQVFLITEPYSYVLVLVNVVLLCLIPLWVAISSRQPASRILLRKGWEPIITAMLISRYSQPFQITTFI